MASAEIKVIDLKAGQKIYVSLGTDKEVSINKDFQISIRPVVEGEAGFRNARDLNVTPELKVRPVHGTKKGLSKGITANSSKAKLSFGNGRADEFYENSVVWESRESEFQTPEKVFDLGAGVSCLVFKDIYCSGFLLDDSATDEETGGDLVVTVVL